MQKLLYGLFLILLPIISFAQPDYDFRNGILISGTNLQVGALYRFNNVKSGDPWVYKVNGHIIPEWYYRRFIDNQLIHLLVDG